jgi:hypothetical protein
MASVRRTTASIAGGGRGIWRRVSGRGGVRKDSERDGGDGCNLHVSVETAAAADVMVRELSLKRRFGGEETE